MKTIFKAAGCLKNNEYDSKIVLDVLHGEQYVCYTDICPY